MDNDQNNEGLLSTPYLEEESEALRDFPENEGFFPRPLYSPYLISELFFEDDEAEGFEDSFVDGFWDESETGGEGYDEPDTEYENEEYEDYSEDEFWDYEEKSEMDYDFEPEVEDNKWDGYPESSDEEEEFIVEGQDSDYDENEYHELLNEAVTKASSSDGNDVILDTMETFKNFYKIKPDDEQQATSMTSNDGTSLIAIQAEKKWDASKDRPGKWIGKVYGLVVHTTGGSLPGKAVEKGIYPTIEAMNHYARGYKNKSFHGGCHYINGWQGIQGGDLLQIANERERAWGVSTKEQRKSNNNGRFEKDLPTQLVRHWKSRWPGYKHSLDLLPDGEGEVNSCYIHVECTPVYYYINGKATISKKYPPMRLGLRFTKAQHDTIAFLACDIAIRNGWPLNTEWWKTPRLLGHEDLTPLTRKDRRGAWDPGFLRDSPYFDWDYVYTKIKEIKTKGYKLPGRGVLASGSGSWGNVIGKSKDAIGSILEKGKLMGVAVATITKGEEDENKITNAVFYAKYPSKRGQKLKSNDPSVRDWLNLRNNLVRPLLAQSKKKVR